MEGSVVFNQDNWSKSAVTAWKEHIWPKLRVFYVTDIGLSYLSFMHNHSCFRRFWICNRNNSTGPDSGKSWGIDQGSQKDSKQCLTRPGCSMTFRLMASFSVTGHVVNFYPVFRLLRWISQSIIQAVSPGELAVNEGDKNKSLLKNWNFPQHASLSHRQMLL